eukprot:305503-Prorocentrum_minimum.AAC.5
MSGKYDECRFFLAVGVRVARSESGGPPPDKPRGRSRVLGFQGFRVVNPNTRKRHRTIDLLTRKRPRKNEGKKII